MAKYKVKIKNSEEETAIEADSDLEAKVKFCQLKGLPYRVYANKIEAIEVSEAKTGQNTTVKRNKGHP